MPKMQVYLPDDLHARVKAKATRINVSNVLQRALEDAIAELDREDALAAAVRDYQYEHGAFTEEELASQREADLKSARRPRPRPRKRGRAA